MTFIKTQLGCTRCLAAAVLATRARLPPTPLPRGRSLPSLRLSAQELDGLYRRDMRSYSLLVLNIAREISRRLRVADGIVAELIADLGEYTRRGT